MRESFRDAISMIDPFILYFFLVPLITIVLGVYIAYRSEKIWVAPLITFAINVLIEFGLSALYPDPPTLEISSTSITLSVFSLLIAFITVKDKKRKRKMRQNKESI